MRGEPHVIRCRHHHIGYDTALEAGHPVGQQLGRQRRRTATATTPKRRKISATRRRPSPSRTPRSRPAPTQLGGVRGDDPAATTISAPRPDGGSSAPTRHSRPPPRPATTASPKSDRSTQRPAQRPHRPPIRSCGPGPPGPAGHRRLRLVRSPGGRSCEWWRRFRLRPGRCRPLGRRR